MDECDLATVDEMDRSLVLARFTVEDAWWLGSSLRQMAIELNAKAAIKIRKGRVTLFQAVLEGATLDNLNWLDRKLATTEHFERSSYAVYLSLKAKEVGLAHYGLDEKNFVAAGGAVPIKVAGVGMIGSVGVSGLPQEEDHRLVRDALSRLASRNPAMENGLEQEA